MRDLFEAQYGALCDSATTEEPAQHQIADLPFTGVGLQCEMADTPLYLFLALGAQGRQGWLVGYVTIEADFERNFETYFAPMLNSLQLGKQ